VLAWQADITRVTTFLMAKELSNAVYPKSGVRDAFHILSHHSNIRENRDRFAVLNRYHVSLLAYLLKKLQSIPDGDGTLLDHSLVLYGSASNLLLAMLDKLGTPAERFGDSTGMLSI